MPRPIINGSREPIRTSIRYSYDPQKGMVTRHEYESAGDGLSGIANQCLQDGIQFEHTANGRRSKLSFESSGNAGEGGDVNADNWQLLCNENSKSIFEHPRVLALVQTDRNNPNSVSSVKDQVKRHDANEPLKTPLQTGDALLLYNMLIRGVSSYQVGGYVLKHTTNVAGNYAANIADIGVEKVYSTPALIREISNVTLWTKPCPARLIYKIQNLDVQIPTNEDLIWGWRKLPAQETMAANNRIDISTEYWLGGCTRLVFEPQGPLEEFP